MINKARRRYDHIPPWAWLLGGGFLAAFGALTYLSSNFVTVAEHTKLVETFNAHLSDNVKLAEKIADKDDSLKLRLEAIQSQLVQVQSELSWTKASLTRLESRVERQPSRP